MLKRSAVAAIFLFAPPALAQEGDPAAGERVFRQCQACHVVDAEQNRVGPHLVGIIGRPSGSVESFNYSDAMANAGLTWDAETLDAYLENPRQYVEGTRMAFAGLRDPEARADVIAYLREAGGTAD